MTMLAGVRGTMEPRIVRRLNEGDQLIYEQIPTNVRFVWDDSFSSPEAEENLFGNGGDVIEIPNWIQPQEAPDEAPTRRGRSFSLSADQEKTLFLRYNYARYRLSLLSEKQKRRVSLPRAQEMLLWYRRVLEAESSLAKANMALVLAMAKRFMHGNLEFGELVSEGNFALLRAIDKFDISRGFKFSTYACISIIRSLQRLAGKHRLQQERFPVEFDDDMGTPQIDWERREATRTAHSLDMLRDISKTNGAGLSEIEQRIIILRFPPDDSRGKTLAEIGASVRLSNERVRQILNVAFAKIRTALEAGMK